MIKNFKYTLLFIIVGGLAQPNISNATDFTLIHGPNERYYLHILKAAIEAADGHHTLSTYDSLLAQGQSLRALQDKTPLYNVVFSGHSTEREKKFSQIDIPLSRGLLGYRAFIILPKSEGHFSSIYTLKDLKEQITIGSAINWPDTHILRRAGFLVRSAPSDLLWRMLRRERFIAFPRGMSEIHFDLAMQLADLTSPPVKIENTVMLHYRFDHFYYLNKEDLERTAIITQGLHRIYKNGKFMELFNAAYLNKGAFQNVNKYKRRIFEIPNPLNSSRINQIPDKFWHSLDDTVLKAQTVNFPPLH
ncbi:MAG: hypothetical protein JKY34_14460 [Kordiimonadaceae bacterium]|nr:hypothetical protein [Kordiimonadaceae bacterium]